MPAASTVFFAEAEFRWPMAAMCPSRMAISAAYQGEPVPSITCPLRITKSNSGAGLCASKNDGTASRNAYFTYLLWHCRRSERRGKSYCAQVQEKLVPSLERAEQVEVWGLVELPDLLISVWFTARKLPIGPLLELSVV
jgi:hypothetical protein